MALAPGQWTLLGRACAPYIVQSQSIKGFCHGRYGQSLESCRRSSADPALSGGHLRMVGLHSGAEGRRRLVEAQHAGGVLRGSGQLCAGDGVRRTQTQRLGAATPRHDGWHHPRCRLLHRRSWRRHELLHGPGRGRPHRRCRHRTRLRRPHRRRDALVPRSQGDDHRRRRGRVRVWCSRLGQARRRMGPTDRPHRTRWNLHGLRRHVCRDGACSAACG